MKVEQQLDNEDYKIEVDGMDEYSIKEIHVWFFWMLHYQNDLRIKEITVEMIFQFILKTNLFDSKQTVDYYWVID